MIWQREYYGATKTNWVITIIALCLVMSIILTQYLAAGVFCFFGVVAFMQSLYFKHVGQKLTLINDKKRSRMLKEGKSNWELTFENRGLPIWNGQLRLQFLDAVRPLINTNVSHSQVIEIVVPLTIGTNEIVTVKVPIEGQKRGLSRLKRLELAVPHLFGEGSVLLIYKPQLLMEQMVYPSIYPLKNIRKSSPLKPGDLEYKHSLFQDLFSPIGTRDYEPGDQFHHIHWKATARMQKLQTKVFTQVANESVLLVLNVVNQYSIISELEQRIEEIASYVDYYYRQNIPYALAVNVRTFSTTPYLLLPTGDGQKQRQKAMEVLSVLSKNDTTMPFKRMLMHLDMHRELPVSVVIFTHDLEDVASYVTRWSKYIHVEVSENQSFGGDLIWKDKSLQNR
ncbi:DUF58 domain-containing protein [Paenisporosarcina sp. TG20]|uniref:DUF58 domain-containing protein n=1 Tax=Paenisporosarcina sp. TG20 TaxID=1211706 RepID=UPI0002E1D458|nr:DUF58 domain-containing protein [Paenisporosarcina sp. TG20]